LEVSKHKAIMFPIIENVSPLDWLNEAFAHSGVSVGLHAQLKGSTALPEE
jgi:hypothetical protein